MSQSDLPQRLAQAHHLVAELRMMQAQMNRTVEHICELVGGHEATALLSQDASSQDGERRVMTPQFLELPNREAYARNPENGYALGPDTRFYSNYRHSLVQILQQAQPRNAESRYSLIINYADFDGDLLSVVVDARKLMQSLPLGRASLGLLLETACGQHCALYAKCAWRVGTTWHERNFDVRANQVAISTVDIERFDPEQIEALDVHLLFNPDSRGSIEIRRAALTLTVQPLPIETAVPAGVFE